MKKKNNLKYLEVKKYLRKDLKNQLKKIKNLKEKMF